MKERVQTKVLRDLRRDGALDWKEYSLDLLVTRDGLDYVALNFDSVHIPLKPDEAQRIAEGLAEAAVTFEQGFFTPAEVEGLTLDEVRFTPRRGWKPIPLAEVPPRVFSEVMRDLDLVVSVAHRGGVDPEATASTVEMRAALVRETCRLLGLGNVEIKSAHALVKGGLGDYSIHLGSAVVHRQPGGALCIVPQHGQHRGRLFLPFVDDDSRSAEVVSKVVLLARDREIKDPSVLEQSL